MLGLGASFPAPAVAQELQLPRWLYFSGTDVAHRSRFSYAGGRFSLAGDLEDDGAIIAALSGIGTYSYEAEISPTGVIDAKYRLAEVAAGFHRRHSNAGITTLIGVRAERHATSVADPDNSLQGVNFGLSLTVDAWWKPTDAFFFKIYASVTSIAAGHYVQAFGGYRVPLLGGFYAGPEAVLTGNESYSQQRLGGRISGLRLSSKLWPLTVSGGYVHGDGDGAGFYMATNTWRKF